MLFILWKYDTYFLPQRLFISHQVNFPDCILAFSYQDGGGKPGVLVKACWLVKKSDGCHRQPFQTVSWYYRFVSTINHSLVMAKADTLTFSRRVKDLIWMEINFISQILGYYSKPFLMSSWDLFGSFVIIRGLF